jgi:hypothetical protein
MVKPAASTPPRRPPREADRFLRPQPPPPIPPRVQPPPATQGNLAHALIGHRVIK